MLRQLMRHVAPLLALGMTVPSSPALAQGKVQLDSVTIHLFLATSGTLSPDIETIQGFGARNFSLQGEGIADNERFYAALMKVRSLDQGALHLKGRSLRGWHAGPGGGD
jgi:hypothetical protein